MGDIGDPSTAPWPGDHHDATVAIAHRKRRGVAPRRASGLRSSSPHPSWLPTCVPSAKKFAQRIGRAQGRARQGGLTLESKSMAGRLRSMLHWRLNRVPMRLSRDPQYSVRTITKARSREFDRVCSKRRRLCDDCYSINGD
jgi:hypothetical protein